MALVPPVPTDRLRGAFLALVKSVAPQLLFLGTYEARVVTASAPSAAQSQLGGVTWVVSAVFTDPAIVKVLPPMANLTMWPGPVWGFSAPAPGSLVRVSFVNGDPSKPAIVGLDPATPPTAVTIGAPVGLPLMTATAQTAITAFATAVVAGCTPPPSTLPQCAASLAAISAAATTLGTAVAVPTAATLITKAA